MAYLASITNGGVPADATDFDDLMDKLLNFLNGTTAPTGGTALTYPWEILNDSTLLVPGERQVFLRGRGFSDTDNIYVFIKVSSVPAINAYNWRIYGCTSYNAGVEINLQPNLSTINSYYLLSPATTPYYFIANERRFMVVAGVSSSTSMAMYAGFYLPYGTPTEMAYPFYAGGSSAKNLSYTTQNYEIGNFYDGPRSSATEYTSFARHSDGTWLGVSAYNGTTSGTRPTSHSGTTFLWPMDRPNSPSAILFEKGMIQDPQGGYPLLPFMLYSADNGGNVYGELDGICFTGTGIAGKKYPDTITIGSDVYLVLNNTYRFGETNGTVLLD